MRQPRPATGAALSKGLLHTKLSLHNVKRIVFLPSPCYVLVLGPSPSSHLDSPMLSVTVMMFSDMVESVMLLKDEDCKERRRRDKNRCASPATTDRWI